MNILNNEYMECIIRYYYYTLLEHLDINLYIHLLYLII